jgi:membrane associated rhomboid family serine protease
MGLYNREYYRDEEQLRFPGGDRPVVITLILINVGIFIVDYFSRDRLGNSQLASYFAVHSDVLTHPWNAWQLLTGGFLHSVRSIWHILFNMYFLWLFGRDVEEWYGRREFLRLYLVLITLSSLIWVLYENALTGFSGQPPQTMIGASGAVTGIMVVFACRDPRRVFLLFGVVPVQAWLLVGFSILVDLMGAVGAEGNSNTAYAAHLGGAAFGYLYVRQGMDLGKIFRAGAWANWFKRRPKLTVRKAEDDDALNSRVDRILEKISRQGEASLTRSERRLLESASRRYQQRRR